MQEANEKMPLSNGEFEIMECVWKADRSLTQTEILRKVNKKTGKQLKVATIATYIRRITWKGYLEKREHGDGHPTYYALVGMKEYYQFEREKFKQRWGDMIAEEGAIV